MRPREGRQTHAHISDQEERRPTTDVLVNTPFGASADSSTRQTQIAQSQPVAPIDSLALQGPGAIRRHGNQFDITTVPCLPRISLLLCFTLQHEPIMVYNGHAETYSARPSIVIFLSFSALSARP